MTLSQEEVADAVGADEAEQEAGVDHVEVEDNLEDHQWEVVFGEVVRILEEFVPGLMATKYNQKLQPTPVSVHHLSDWPISIITQIFKYGLVILL